MVILRSLCRQWSGPVVLYNGPGFPVRRIVTGLTDQNGFGARAGVQVRFASQSKTKTHYDILEVATDASPKDIKSAFYRLSMKLHPDRNANKPGAAQAFQKVSEAYQVLSNAQAREEYDMKVLGLARAQRQQERQDPMARTRGPPPTGRSKIYNFDEFYRQHYGTRLQKDIDLKQRYEAFEKDRDGPSDGQIPNWVLIVGTLVCVWCASMVFTKSNDRVKK